MLSLALNLQVPAELAMTAELNLDGKVCSVGAVEEKLMADKTGGYKHIILPIDNKAQWNNIPTELRQSLAEIQSRFKFKMWYTTFRFDVISILEELSIHSSTRMFVYAFWFLLFLSKYELGQGPSW